MGDGADMEDAGQGGGGGWGGTPDYVPRGQFIPAQQPQYAPQPTAQQYVPVPTYQQPPPPTRRRGPGRRRSSKVEERLALLHYFEELLAQPVFDDPADPYATAVQEELYVFAQRRVDELLGDATPKADSAFSPEEAAALKVLAQKMMAPDEDDAVADRPLPAAAAPAPRPPPPPPAPVRGPRGCPNPECQFPPHASADQCSNVQPPQQPPQRPQQPPQASPPPPPPPSGPRVIQRPSAAQRAALEASRARPPPPPPPPQPVYQQPPAPVRGRRGRKGQAPAAPVPVAAPLPPVLRYAMPQGQHMTMVTGMKAEEQIASGGTVLSETLVKSR